MFEDVLKHVKHSCLWRRCSLFKSPHKTREEEKGAGPLALLYLTLTDMES